jgi:magnesium transporter
VAIRILASRDGGDAIVEPTVDELPALLGSVDCVVWVDLSGEGKEEERLLSDVFKFHPLIIEDAFRDATNPKVEEFDDYVYLIVRGLDSQAEEPRDVQLIELDLFLGRNFVVTHHSKPLRSVENTFTELQRIPKALRKGAPYVAHSILDKLVDYYLPLMTKFDEQIEELEQKVIQDPQSEHLQIIFDMKSSLQRIRRMSIHQKDILERLAKGEFELIPEPALPFFRDVYDHFVRVADLSESFRDLVGSALTAYMSQQSAKMNEIMKVLTLISTVMLPLTFIAGIYGMNFDPEYSPFNMPEIRWLYGYPYAIGLMAVVGIGLVIYFKSRKWL